MGGGICLGAYTEGWSKRSATIAAHETPPRSPEMEFSTLVYIFSPHASPDSLQIHLAETRFQINLFFFIQAWLGTTPMPTLSPATHGGATDENGISMLYVLAISFALDKISCTYCSPPLLKSVSFLYQRDWRVFFIKWVREGEVRMDHAPQLIL